MSSLSNLLTLILFTILKLLNASEKSFSFDDYYLKASVSLKSVVTNSSKILIVNSLYGEFKAAISSNGKSGESIYFFNKNNNNSWTKINNISSSSGGWGSIYMSANGSSTIVSTVSTCGPEYSKLYVSNDYGLSFHLAGGLPDLCNGFWKISTSSNGQYMYATNYQMYGRNILRSSNYGLNWTTTTTYAASVVASNNGSRLVAFNSLSYIISISENYGGNWTSSNYNSNGLPNALNYGSYNPIIASSNMKYLIIGSEQAYSYSSQTNIPIQIFTSSDYGETWVSTLELSNGEFSSVRSISMSSDGRYVVFLINNHNLYLSNDYGMNWENTQVSSDYYSISIVNNKYDNDVISFVIGTISGAVLDVVFETTLNCSTTDEHLLLPNSTLEIYSEQYKSCFQLKSVAIPSSVTFIGDNAFIGCSSLSSIRFQTGIVLTEHNVNNFLTSLSKNDVFYKTQDEL